MEVYQERLQRISSSVGENLDEHTDFVAEFVNGQRIVARFTDDSLIDGLYENEEMIEAGKAKTDCILLNSLVLIRFLTDESDQFKRQQEVVRLARDTNNFDAVESLYSYRYGLLLNRDYPLVTLTSIAGMTLETPVLSSKIEVLDSDSVKSEFSFLKLDKQVVGAYKQVSIQDNRQDEGLIKAAALGMMLEHGKIIRASYTSTDEEIDEMILGVELQHHGTHLEDLSREYQEILRKQIHDAREVRELELPDNRLPTPHNLDTLQSLLSA